MRALVLGFLAALTAGCLSLPTLDQHRFACDGGAGQCPGNWVCSLGDQTCHDPDAGNYACLTNQDCGRFICSQADHLCHDPSDGGYACATSADCAYPFACGLGTCVNLATDEIDLTLAPLCLDAGTQTSPFLNGLPDLFEMSEPYLLQTSHGPVGAQNLAWSANGSTGVLLSTPLGIQAGNAGNQAYIQALDVAPTTPSAMGSVGGSVLWTDATGFHAFVLNAGGSQVTGTVQNFPPGVSPKGFRSSAFQTLFAFENANFAYFVADMATNDGDAGSLALYTGSLPGDNIIDMVETSSGAIAATDHGLFTASYTAPNTSGVFTWQAMQVESIYDGGYWAILNDGCSQGFVQGTPTAMTPAALYPGQVWNGNLDGLMIEATAPDGTTLMTQFRGSTGCYMLDGTNITPPCPPCPSGYTKVAALNAFFFNGSDYIDQPTARCRNAAGTQEQVFEVVFPDPTRTDRTVCQWEAPEGYGLPRIEQDLSLSQMSDPTRGGLVGEHGQIWLTPDAGFIAQPQQQLGGLTTVQPLLLAQAPDFHTQVAFGPYDFDVANTGDVPWLLTEGVGYARGIFNSQNVDPLATVQGQPQWFALAGTLQPLQDEVWDTRGATGVNHLPPVVVYLDPARAGQRPVHAAIAPTADGGTLLLATEFDAFMSGDVTSLAPLQATAPPSETAVNLSIVALPEVEVPIVALAAVSPPREGYAEAYVLTTLQVLHMEALGATRWTQELLNPPADPTNWVDLWTDGDRARIGFASGVVYALPTDVPLSQPIPGTLPVLSYAHEGDTTFALTAGDLYRLAPVGPGMPATWTSVLSQTGLSAGDLVGGRMFADQGQLTLFSQFGQAFRVPLAASCP